MTIETKEFDFITCEYNSKYLLKEIFKYYNKEYCENEIKELIKLMIITADEVNEEVVKIFENGEKDLIVL